MKKEITSAFLLLVWLGLPTCISVLLSLATGGLRLVTVTHLLLSGESTLYSYEPRLFMGLVANMLWLPFGVLLTDGDSK